MIILIIKNLVYLVYLCYIVVDAIKVDLQKIGIKATQNYRITKLNKEFNKLIINKHILQKSERMSKSFLKCTKNYKMKIVD